jgi:hypothetical protein
VEAKVAEISVDIRLTAQNKPKIKYLDNITGKASLILREIWVFPNLSGILRLFFSTTVTITELGAKKELSQAGKFFFVFRYGWPGPLRMHLIVRFLGKWCCI